MKLSKINKRFKIFTLIKCESQREKKEKIYRIIRERKSIMFINIL